MNYEKAYKDALERAKGIHSFSSDIAEIKRMEQIFPELAESEDDRIRKALIEYFKRYREIGTCGSETFSGIPTDNILAWLEKQVEQKSVLDELEMTLSVSEEGYLCENIEKLIKELKR